MDFDLPPPPLASSSQSDPIAAPPPQVQRSMMVNPEEIKKWTVLYPAYFDRNLSRNSGRRVTKDLAYPNVDLQHLLEACRMAFNSINPALMFLPERKRHPQDPLRNGRIRVQLKTASGQLANPKDVPTKEALLKLIGSKMEEAAGPAEILRKRAEESFRQQQELQMRQAAAQQQAAAKQSGQQMSLPAMMGAGGMMYQPSDALKKAASMPFGKVAGAKAAGKAATAGAAGATPAASAAAAAPSKGKGKGK